MCRVLLTAFQPYDGWPTNASWLTLAQLTRDLPAEPQVTTRLYPVDFLQVGERLERDLRDDYDVALMLGQAPGKTAIEFEAVGINVALEHGEAVADASYLVADGPAAYRSKLPLDDWARRIRDAGVPARVSYYAGTFLCNAALYLAHFHIERLGLATRAGFVHLPLDPSQVVEQRNPMASMPVELTAGAIRQVLETLSNKTPFVG